MDASKYVICIDNDGYSASLQARKLYERIRISRRNV